MVKVLLAVKGQGKNVTMNVADATFYDGDNQPVQGG